MTFAAKGSPPEHGGDPLELSSLGGVDLQANIPIKAPAQEENRARLRRQRLVERLHALGPAPLGHFLREIESGASIRDHLERYSRIDPDFVKLYHGDRFQPALRVVVGGAP